MTTPFIYLASQSPRRAQLLEQLGVGHRLLLAGSDEDAEALEATRVREAPATYVRRVTALKLDAAVERHARQSLPPAPILCADTTVALGAKILGKPEDAKDARRMLRLLSGRTHRVLTAIALQHGKRRHAALSVSRVRFAPLTARQKLFPAMNKIVLESPAVHCVKKAKPYAVTIRLLGPEDAEIQRLKTTIASNVDQSLLPAKPLSLGPLYDRNPAVFRPDGSTDFSPEACPE